MTLKVRLIMSCTNILYNCIIDLGIFSKIANWIHTYFSKRNIYIKYHSKTIGPYSCNKGIPQGSILSAILYAIYTTRIDNLRGGKTEILQYADDIVIYCSGCTLNIAQKCIQLKLNKLKQILDQLQLEVSTSKSSAVIFTKHRLNRSPRIYYNSQTIKIMPHAKFLGVWFDTKFNWEKEIQDTSNKCFKGINLLRCIAGFKWGAHPITMLNLYKSLIHPHLDYAGTLIASSTSTRKKKLDRIQYSAIRLSLGVMKSTPTQILNY